MYFVYMGIGSIVYSIGTNYLPMKRHRGQTQTTFSDWTPDFYADVATLFVNEESDVLSAGVPNGLKVIFLVIS